MPLGGAMALAADKGGIQFRILNSRKGAAEFVQRVRKLTAYVLKLQSVIP